LHNPSSLAILNPKFINPALRKEFARMKPWIVLFTLSLLASGCQAALLSATAPARVVAQRSTAPIQQAYHSTAILKIQQPSQTAQALAALRQLQAQTRLEPGNLTFTVHQDQQDPQTIVIWETFRDEAAFQQHLKSPHLQTFLNTQLLTFQQGFAATRPTQAVPPQVQGYFSTALLTLREGKTLAQAQQALAELEAASRQEKGVKAFLTFAITNSEPTRFVIWEQFQDEAAFQAHLNSPHLEKFLGSHIMNFDQGYTLRPIG
jgi:quinol monooxygenase YgiN